jgi:hypothetical protein
LIGFLVFGKEIENGEIYQKEKFKKEKKSEKKGQKMLHPHDFSFCSTFSANTDYI